MVVIIAAFSHALLSSYAFLTCPSETEIAARRPATKHNTHNTHDTYFNITLKDVDRPLTSHTHLVEKKYISVDLFTVSLKLTHKHNLLINNNTLTHT